jgi:hypothetical protein
MNSLPLKRHARPRAREAAADEGGSDVAQVGADTEPDAAGQHEAQQVVPTLKARTMRRPPAQQRLPLDQLAETLIRKSRRHGGEVQAAMLGWLIDLEAAGLTAAEAEAAILADGAAVVANNDTGDLVEMLTVLMRGRVTDRKSEAATG